SSHYKLAEKLRESGEIMQAAREYAKAAVKYPNSTVAEMALIQAGKQFEAAGDTVSAALIYEKFLDKYPDSKLLDKVAVTAAAYREKMKQWDKAAEDYLKIVEVNSPLKAKALYFAANCYYQKKDWNKSIDLYTKYITIFDNYNHYVEALFKIGEGYYTQSNPQMALTFLKKALNVYGNHKKDNLNPYYAANAAFLIGEIHFQDYLAIQITSDFASSLNAKKKYLKICLQDFKRTIDFRVAEWVTASYYEIGRAWEEFANAMINSPLPKNLSTEEVAAYQLKLNEAAAPLLKKAAKYYQANLKQGKKNHIVNKWIQKSLTHFASLIQKGVKVE
ncbi:MAG TPA: tetratricopeptide repeat protein, partial [Bacteroidetes bacterium]|nr:tetratricopeptide repeat protein [Bacteroidota bacterium]